MTRCSSAVALCAALALAVSLMTPLLAQDQGRDQANDVEAAMSMGGVGSLFQGFTPTATRLAAVSLQFRPGGQFPATGCSTTVKVRSGSVTGQVLATTSASVPPIGATPTPIVFFLFQPPVELKPGQPYAIEWVSPEGGDAVLAWMVTQKDTYPGGTAFDAKGAPLATQDFVFATYQQAPPEALADKLKADLGAELAAGDKLLADGKDAEANAHFARVVEIAAQADSKALGADEWYAIGSAHCCLMAAAFDKALQIGGLGKDREQAAQSWRDLVYAPPEPQVDKVRIIGHGDKVDLADYIVKGKTTIVDFSSEFCGPCRQIGPKLEALAKGRDDIYVVKVDINRPGVQGIDWQSPVAKQYGLQSIPAFKVYGPDGKLQAEGDQAYGMVMGWVQ